MIRAHLLAVLVLATPALATAQQARDGAVIVMSGEGLVQVAPVRVDSIDRVGELLDIAVAGGRAVERVVRIEEHGVQSRPPVPFVAAREALQADAPPIAAGQIELRSQVTVTVELK